MTDARVPAWHVAVGRSIRPEEVYRVFRALLDDLPMSRSELARRIGITQPAVSRWASGDTRPGLVEMRATLEAVSARTAEIQEIARRTESIISLVEEAVRMHDTQGAPDELRQHEARREITHRLAMLLEEK